MVGEFLSEHTISLVSLLVIIIYFVGVMAALDALYLARVPQSAIAWGISLITFPYVVLPFYWVFGRTHFVGYREKIKQFSSLYENELSAYYQTLSEFVAPPSQIGSVFEHSFEAIANDQFKLGNNVDLLIDGQEFFDRLLNEMHLAQEYILFQFYLIRCDEIGQKVQNVLIERARAGVAVYFLYDEVGSSTLTEEYLSALTQAGIKVSEFGTRKGRRNFLQFNFRNHRKTVVIDGKRAFVGGFNIGDEYLGRDPDIGHWRDTALLVEGPAVIPIQVVFFNDWFWATRESADVKWDNVQKSGDVNLLCVPTGPADNKEKCLLLMTEIINSAQKRLWIANSYFIPDESLFIQLELAVLRGVDVRLIIPHKPDNYPVWMASFSFLSKASSIGIRVYKYAEGLLHQKVILVDETITSIGTANWDNRSIRLNFELTIISMDPSLNKRVETMLIKDMSRSVESPVVFDNLPLGVRLQSKFARLFAPVL